MKEILTRLFAHEELSTTEARDLMRGFTRGEYTDAVMAALLTVYQMRSVTVNELVGFREALLETRVPSTFQSSTPLTS